VARQGERIAWADVPETTRAATEAVLGSPVVAYRSATAGFSPGPAGRATLSDGRQVFVKSCGPELNPVTPTLIRAEHAVLRELPPEVPAPAVVAYVDDGSWVTLVTEFVDGVTPTAPLSPSDVDAALGLLTTIASVEAPTSPTFRTVPDTVQLRGWQQLLDDIAADDGKPPARLDEWSRRNLVRCAAPERPWNDAVAGDHLLHLDLRTDNIVIGADRTVAVDWANGGRGAPWVDLIAMLPAMELDGGPTPGEVLRRHPIGRAADPEAVDAVVAVLAGYFTRQALLPPPPGLPTIRAFQAAQGAITRTWLAERTGWR
jgi:aminoglycoside phosphotransferase (APT) family kinase protein